MTCKQPYATFLTQWRYDMKNIRKIWFAVRFDNEIVVAFPRKKDMDPFLKRKTGSTAKWEKSPSR